MNILTTLNFAPAFRRAARVVASLLVAAAVATGLAACTDDDDNTDENPYPADLIGQWEAVEQTTTLKQEGLEDQVTTDNHPALRLYIHGNGIFETFKPDATTGQWATDIRGPWAYSSSNNVLVVAPTELTRLIYQVKGLTRSQLVLVETVQAVSDDESAKPVVFVYRTVFDRMDAE